jgi:hypothetical protein
MSHNRTSPDHALSWCVRPLRMPLVDYITLTDTRYSALPLERVHLVSRFEDFRLSQIRRGIVYLFAVWSVPSVLHFRSITEALSRIDWSDLEFYVVDIDCVPEDFMRATFQCRAAGAGETLWVRDGVVVASILTYSHAEVKAEVMRRTRELLDCNAASSETGNLEA